jgi:hypothetical protein
LNKNAASGVDEVTAQAYEENLEANIQALQFCRKLTGLNAITPAGKSLVIEVGRSPEK